MHHLLGQLWFTCRTSCGITCCTSCGITCCASCGITCCASCGITCCASCGILAVLFAVLPAAPLVVLLAVPVELAVFDPFVDEEAFLFDDTIFAAELEAEFPVFSKVPAEQPLNVTAAISAIILTIFIFMVKSPFIFLLL